MSLIKNFTSDQIETLLSIQFGDNYEITKEQTQCGHGPEMTTMEWDEGIKANFTDAVETELILESTRVKSTTINTQDDLDMFQTKHIARGL